MDELSRVTDIMYQRHVASLYGQQYTNTFSVVWKVFTMIPDTNQIEVIFDVIIDLNRIGTLPTPTELTIILEDFPIDLYIENYADTAGIFAL